MNWLNYICAAVVVVSGIVQIILILRDHNREIARIRRENPIGAFFSDAKRVYRK